MEAIHARRAYRRALEKGRPLQVCELGVRRHEQGSAGNGGLASLTIEDIVAPGFSTPWDAPTVPPFPFSFRNVEVLTLAWRTSEAAVARLLPPPLTATSDVVLAHIYRMNDTDWLGPYNESNVSVGARLDAADLSGSYSPYLLLSSDVGVVHCREVHGQAEETRRTQGSSIVAISSSASWPETGSRSSPARWPTSSVGTPSASPGAPFRFFFYREHQSEGASTDRRHVPRDPAAHGAAAGRCLRARMLERPLHRRASAQRPGADPPAPRRRNARRLSLARRFHSDRRAGDPRLSAGEIRRS